jgi:agmatinase
MPDSPSGSGRFLDVSGPGHDYSTSKVVIWPVPYEKTTSWGHGTAMGPRAILEASAYVEEYDEELDWEPSIVGLHTLPQAAIADLDEADAIRLLYEEARRHVGARKFILTLGGEHTLSTPVVQAVREEYSDLSVLQIDAHADLRDSYEGTRYSHASVMRRIVELCPAVQVGIRSLSREERDVAEELPTRLFFAKDLVEGTVWIDDVVAALSEHVYLTVDIDGLDPSLVFATGTPEPGGLDWYSLLRLLRRVSAERTIVSADIVELMPLDEIRAPDFLCAKLAYKILSYALVGDRR